MNDSKRIKLHTKRKDTIAKLAKENHVSMNELVINMLNRGLKDNFEPKDFKKEPITIVVGDALFDKLCQMAKKNNTTYTEVIHTILDRNFL